MRYFKTPNDQVRAVAADQTFLIQDDWNEITETQVKEIVNPPATLKALSTAALRRINAGYSQAMSAILAEYPDAETLSFDKQEAQARAWDAWQKSGAVPRDEPATAYLDAMLAERPIGKPELVARILAKAAQFEAMHGAATGRRQRLEDDVKAAQEAGDREALEAITW